MGEVYRARDTRLARGVAIKVLQGVAAESGRVVTTCVGKAMGAAGPFEAAA